MKLFLHYIKVHSSKHLVFSVSRKLHKKNYLSCQIQMNIMHCITIQGIKTINIFNIFFSFWRMCFSKASHAFNFFQTWLPMKCPLQCPKQSFLHFNMFVLSIYKRIIQFQQSLHVSTDGLILQQDVFLDMAICYYCHYCHRINFVCNANNQTTIYQGKLKIKKFFL